MVKGSHRRESMPRSILLALAFFAFPLAASAAGKPNVLIVMTDDQGLGDFSSSGNPVLKTPNLDAFARRSVRLTDSHAAPMCSPTRGQLLTGAHRPGGDGGLGPRDRAGEVGMSVRGDPRRQGVEQVCRTYFGVSYRSTLVTWDCALRSKGPGQKTLRLEITWACDGALRTAEYNLLPSSLVRELPNGVGW
jgi:hypothetical protein